MPRPRLATLALLALACLLAAPAGADAAGKRPTYKTPGYKGTKKAPRTRPARPPAEIPLAAAGKLPNAIVDEAGTAHIVWTEEGPGGSADILHYCRVQRGSRACDNPEGTRAFIPEQPNTPGNSPDFNEDNDGPRVLALGDQLVLLTRRYPNGVPKPNNGDVDTSVYIWVSDDGGNSFTGPGLTADGYLSGGAVPFSVGGDLRIATISDTVTGGTYLQILRPGAFTAGYANLGANGPDRAYSGSLAQDGGTIAAAFADLSNQTIVRRWNGQGDPGDAGNWTEDPPIPGSEPRLAGGPAGLYLMNRPQPSGQYAVRSLSGGGGPVTVSSGDAVERDLFQDASGRLHASWVKRSGARAELMKRISVGGRRFDSATLLARAGGIGSVDIASASDGGGFAVFQRDSEGRQGAISAVGFGTRAATEKLGLGARSGGGLPAGTVSSCQKVSYGAVRMLSDEGCLLGSAGKGGVKVSEGTLRLNGLEIVPDAGVKIILDPRKHTIDTTGNVRVILRAPAVGEIVLWHGELHISLPDAGAGTLLASLDASKFKGALKGFPFEGKIDVILEKDAVRIPVFLQLPPEFGGVTGEATLRADNERGFYADSLKIEVRDVMVGPLELKKLRVEWATGDNWSAEFALALPPQGNDLSGFAEFENGDFVRAGVRVPLPPPGIALFSGVFLTEVGAEFGLKPLEIAGLLEVTAVGTVTIDGTVRAKFPDDKPAEFSISGEFAIVDLGFANASALLRTDGYFQADVGVDLDVTLASIDGRALVVIDGPAGQFGAEVEAEVCVRPVVPLCGTGLSVLSSKGLGICVGASKDDASGSAYASYRWGEPIPDGVNAELGSCSLDDVRVRPRAAQAGATVFTVARASRVESLQVHGQGGAPSVTLVSPSGERIAVAPQPGAGVRAWGGALNGTATAAIALPNPAPGNWRIEPDPGSAPIAGVEQKSDRGPLALSAQVRKGRGRKRLLAYRVERRPGVTVRFVERGNKGGGHIGVARRARGSISFEPGPGNGGRRRVVAVVERDGLPTEARTLTSYKAPGPARPGRVRGLKLSRRGKGVAVRWRAASGARRYAVNVRTSRGMSRLILTRKRKLRVAGIRRGDGVKVSVRGLSEIGLSGPQTRKSLRR